VDRACKPLLTTVGKALVYKLDITLLSYTACGLFSQATTSGAIQYGVPINELRFSSSRRLYADTPKSAGTRVRRWASRMQSYVE
jgi:hypothetical protein